MKKLFALKLSNAILMPMIGECEAQGWKMLFFNGKYIIRGPVFFLDRNPAKIIRVTNIQIYKILQTCWILKIQKDKFWQACCEDPDLC